jgi:N-acetylglutamate synthase-like GNAT family acetyltransferase
MEVQRQEFIISTDKSKLDIPYIRDFLSKSYWAENIPVDTVQRSIEGSLCFGVYYQNKQIGFARLITDSATFAYLADVFIDEAYRGNGLSKWLMETIMDQANSFGLRRFMLATRDAHDLYRKYGFKDLVNADRWMEIAKPGIYKVQ